MAIYFPQQDVLILLPAKTASSWLRRAVLHVKTTHRFLGPPEFRGHGPLQFYGRKFRFIAAFIRDPYDWHVSYWNYRTFNLGFWDAKRGEIDRIAGGVLFAEYIHKLYPCTPDCVERYFARFIGPREDRIQFVGKSEQIVTDFFLLLDMHGIGCDTEAIRFLPRQNSQTVKVSDESLRSLVSENETTLYSEYYSHDNAE